VDDDGKDLQLEYVSPAFERALSDAGLDEPTRQKIFERVRVTGTCQDVDLVPEKIRDAFVVASDIIPEQHVRMQAALQAFVDNSMSKTINFSATATTEDVEQAYFLAWKLGCKGITVYVAGSREQVVLETRETSAKKSAPSETALVKKPRPRAVHGSTYEIATPLGKDKRAPWFKNVAPTYAGIFLWFVFWQDAAKAGSLGGTLSQGVGVALLFAAVPRARSTPAL
jgi:ribonucleoside-diphosphate reductase alpha chain